jgi:hypothetical protein
LAQQHCLLGYKIAHCPIKVLNQQRAAIKSNIHAANNPVNPAIGNSFPNQLIPFLRK